MIYIGGFMLLLGLVSLCTGLFSVLALPLMIIGVVLACVGAFSGESTKELGEGMKDGCGCIITIVVIIIGIIIALGYFLSRDDDDEAKDKVTPSRTVSTTKTSRYSGERKPVTSDSLSAVL